MSSKINSVIIISIISILGISSYSIAGQSSDFELDIAGPSWNTVQKSEVEKDRRLDQETETTSNSQGFETDPTLSFRVNADSYAFGGSIELPNAETFSFFWADRLTSVREWGLESTVMFAANDTDEVDTDVEFGEETDSLTYKSFDAYYDFGPFYQIREVNYESKLGIRYFMERDERTRKDKLDGQSSRFKDAAGGVVANFNYDYIFNINEKVNLLTGIDLGYRFTSWGSRDSGRASPAAPLAAAREILNAKEIVAKINLAKIRVLF